MAEKFEDSMKLLLEEAMELQMQEAQPSTQKAQALLALLLKDTSEAEQNGLNTSDASEPSMPESNLYEPQDGTTLTGDLIMDSNPLLTRKEAEELAKFT